MKSTVIIFSLLFSLVATGQKKKSNEDLILFTKTVAIQELISEELENALHPDDTISITIEQRIRRDFAVEIKENILDNVIENYEQLISEFPKSDLIFRALNNKGFAEMQLESYTDAKETFLKLLNSKANDKEKGGVGSGLMGEPYANYKNRAAKVLAEIAIEEENYQEALKYLEETKKYPYHHFCGNEYAAEDIYMAEMYSQCYLGLKQYEQAYDILLPNIIENGLASNFTLVNSTLEALLITYKKDDLKTQFENSFKNVTIIKEKQNKNEYTSYYINFLNRKIPLESWQLSEFLTDQEREKVLNEILTQSEFYKLLIK